MLSVNGGNGSAYGSKGNTVSQTIGQAVTAPATVAAEPLSDMPLGRKGSGKAAGGDDAEVRRPAVPVTHA